MFMPSTVDKTIYLAKRVRNDSAKKARKRYPRTKRAIIPMDVQRLPFIPRRSNTDWPPS